MLRELSFVVLGGVAVLACKQAPAPAEQQAAPNLQAAPVAAAVEAATPPPAPKLATVSYAFFDGASVVTCTDKTGPAEKVAAFKVDEPATKLSQSCDSLGRVALTVCDYGHSTIKYYLSKESDKHMADCVKTGGKWTTNKSPEAQMARAEQDLAAANAAAGMP